MEDDNAFSTEERDIHVVNHPAVIPLIELTKGCIIAVRPNPNYYENIDEEPEPFWLAQIVRQKTNRRNGSEIVQVFKVVWFHSHVASENGTSIYNLNEEDFGTVFYPNILLHNIHLTLHNHLPVATRRKLMNLLQ